MRIAMLLFSIAAFLVALAALLVQVGCRPSRVFERPAPPKAIAVRTKFCSAVYMTRRDNRIPHCREV